MKKNRKKRKNSFWKIMKFSILIFIFLSIMSIVVANAKITRQTRNMVYDDKNKIPENKVGLVLGTSKMLRNGRQNDYFTNRISAAVDLFNLGKIKYIVVSGDNSNKYYNEPADMKKELVKRGVPEDRIYLDYAGFRTFDSVYRMKAIFGQNSFTVISQKFHNQRAVYIGKSLNINVVGYNAKDVYAYSGFKTKLREKFARVKMFIDLIINKKPKFLGEKIIID